MVLLILIIPLFVLLIKVYNREGVTHKLCLAGLYFITSTLGLVYMYAPVEQSQVYDCGFFSVVFYTLCIFIFLSPLLKTNAKPDFGNQKKLVKIFTAFLILGAICTYIYSIRTFDITKFAYGWADVKEQYYEVLKGEQQIHTAIDVRILLNISPILFYCFPLFFYYLSIRENKTALILFFCAFATVFEGVLRAERQVLVVWMIDAMFFFFMFRKKLSDNTLKFLKKVFFIIVGVFVTLIVAVTISRFEDRDGGVLESLFVYGGSQPHNACYFLEQLGGQELWGQLNFPYITNYHSYLEINDYVVADRYLNVFGSIVGSYILDFGYMAIIAASIIAIIFLFLIKVLSKNRPFLKFYFYSLYAQILIYGIFYNKMTSYTEIRTFVVFALLILFLEKKKLTKNM